jgi:hypothetical protein
MKRVKHLRGRLSYANVAATLALFLALGGGAAIAANQIKARDIAKDAVGGSELKKNAAKGKHVKESTLSAVPTAGKANNVLWAVVRNPAGNGNATLARAGQTNTGVNENGGRVEVEFGRDVTNCVWLATRGSVSTVDETPGFVQVSLGITPTRVDVRTRNTEGQPGDGDFHIVVIC